jgi:hypothetical protein
MKRWRRKRRKWAMMLIWLSMWMHRFLPRDIIEIQSSAFSVFSVRSFLKDISCPTSMHLHRMACTCRRCTTLKKSHVLHTWFPTPKCEMKHSIVLTESDTYFLKPAFKDGHISLNQVSPVFLLIPTMSAFCISLNHEPTSKGATLSTSCW